MSVAILRAGFPYKQTKHVLRASGRRGLQNLPSKTKITSFKSLVHCAELQNYSKFSTKMLVDAELIDGSKSMTAMLRKSASVQ